jgi:hypothetical protein
VIILLSLFRLTRFLREVCHLSSPVQNCWLSRVPGSNARQLWLPCIEDRLLGVGVILHQTTKGNTHFVTGTGAT